LNRFDAQTSTFEHLTTRQGLGSDTIDGIIQDVNGILWVSTDSGLTRLNPANRQIKNFTISEGLPSQNFTPRSAAADFNGRIYFGTTDGLLVFQPERLSDSGFQPPVAITKISSEGQLLQAGIISGNKRQIDLRWPQNSFEFEFSALEYSEPDKNQYTYKLEPLEKEWTINGNKRNGRYTNLAGGDYTLFLKAANKDGIWNDQALVASIRVIPPMWETWWFRLLALLFLTAFGIYLYRLRLKTIERQNFELETLVRERTHLINQRNQEIEALYQADTKMYRYLNIHQAMQALVDVAVEMLKADKSCVLAWDMKEKAWTIQAHQGFHCQPNLPLKISGDDPIFKQVTDHNQAITINHFEAKRAHERSALYTHMAIEKIGSFILIPIKNGEELFALFIVAFGKPNAFNKDLQRLFTSLSQRAALSIENALLFEQTKQLAVVEERTRLARDLHDSAKQKAFAALAQIGAVRGTMKNSPVHSNEHLKEAEDLVYEVIQELTFLIQEMYPLTLKEEGLLPALREYAFEWENRNDIPVEVRASQEIKLDLVIEQTLYRIIQEALSNVARHSQAKRVQISLHSSANKIEACIEDDGRGFKTNEVSKGLGLHSMDERAASQGGEVEITSQPGKGTKVCVRLPI
jgi:signal transduction histidine kinase